MANGGLVKFYLDHVRVQVRAASDKFLEAVALRIEGQTKANIQRNSQIDTGFMLNSTYTVTKKGDSSGNALPSGSYPNSEGHSVKRVIGPPPSLPSNASAAVVVGAEYAIYQEAKKPFLYPAAETVAGQAGGQALEIIRRELHD
jgi:hypothetical protein